MLDGVLAAAHGDRRVGVGTAVLVDEQRVALGVVTAVREGLRDMDQAAVGRTAFADGDRLRDDVRGRVIGRVNHLRTGVLVLTIVGQGDREDLAAGALAAQDHAGILHRQTGTDIAIDPADFGVLFGHAALRHEIKDVGGPVLDGDVLDLRALEGDELDDRGVQGGGLELGSRAAFHVGDFRAFVGDDERALELTEVLGVDAEVGLQGLGHLHALGDVDE